MTLHTLHVTAKKERKIKEARQTRKQNNFIETKTLTAVGSNCTMMVTSRGTGQLIIILSVWHKPGLMHVKAMTTTMTLSMSFSTQQQVEMVCHNVTESLTELEDFTINVLANSLV